MQPRITVGDDLNTDLDLTPEPTSKPLAKLAREAQFMEEVLEIEITPSSNENDNNVVILNVNGVNQPVTRGVVTPVKRKYVEVLARMKQTNYSQRSTDYINPERSNELIPRTGQVYPFQIHKDPSGTKGISWVRAILAEPA